MCKIRSYDKLTEVQLCYLEHLLDQNDSNSIIVRINRIFNIDNDELLLIIKCKIYIELERYEKAKQFLDRLFKLYNDDISFLYLLEKHSEFWSYLCEYYGFKNFGILDDFNKYMY